MRVPLFVVALLLIGAFGLRVAPADGRGQHCIVLLSQESGDQESLLRTILKVREELGIPKRELPVAELAWNAAPQQHVIESTIGLGQHELPLATTGLIAKSGMPTSANRSRPDLGLPKRVIAFYLINEWARRTKRSPYYWPYGRSKKLPQPPEARNPVDGSILVSIPPGPFWMGSTEGEIDELPPRQVQQKPFAIGRTEVTVAQYRRFVEATGYRTEAEEIGYGYVWRGDWERTDGVSWRDPAGLGGVASEEHPVRQVSLADCEAYCRWAELRLPSEQEWEKSARGEAGVQYPWGNTWYPERAVHAAKTPAPVGSKSQGRSPYGLHDMAGNVREWTSTPYQPYLETIESTKSGRRYAVRGGSFREARPLHLRGSYRFNSLARTSSDLTGFRVAKDFDSDLGFNY